jgi:hypothetical protein
MMTMTLAQRLVIVTLPQHIIGNNASYNKNMLINPRDGSYYIHGDHP